MSAPSDAEVLAARHGLPARLGYLVEQLWRTPLEDPHARVVVGSAPAEPGWQAAESYLVLPTAGRANLLIPSGPRAATAGSLLNFRGLRRRIPNAERALLGTAARIGVAPFPRLTLQVREGEASPDLPLTTLQRALGTRRMHASIGVNTSANRKATLQLVSDQGAPQGFAKFAWEAVSDRSVQTEAAALEAVGGRTGRVRAPALSATGDYYGHPYLVSDPLPLDSVGVRAGVTLPSPQELFAILPIVRRDRVAGTGQFAALRERVSRLPREGSTSSVVARVEELLSVLAQSAHEVPVQARCHGDLAAWNTARSADGTLWLWDWESSEVDVAAGLDPLHWTMSEGTEHGLPWDGSALVQALAAATPALRAAGASAAATTDVVALYAATIAERACTLAAGSGGWEEGWVTPGQLEDMLRVAADLMRAPASTTR